MVAPFCSGTESRRASLTTWKRIGGLRPRFSTLINAINVSASSFEHAPFGVVTSVVKSLTHRSQPNSVKGVHSSERNQSNAPTECSADLDANGTYGGSAGGGRPLLLRRADHCR